MADELGAKVHATESLKQKSHYFIYISPVWMDVTGFIQSGQLLTNKSVLKPLRLNNALPSQGDGFIVLKERPGNARNYNLISLCRVLRPAQKMDEVQEINKQYYAYVINVLEESVGGANSENYSAAVDMPEIEKMPAILPTTEDVFAEAIMHFPFLAINEKIAQIVSPLKNDRHGLQGYVYDLEKLKLCRMSDFLSHIGNDMLEAEIRARIPENRCYDMIDRLHKEALREKGADLSKMDPRQFEKICGELVRHRGLRVTETKYTADQGVDLYAEDDSVFHRGMYIFQMKRTVSVGVEVIRQLDSVIREKNAIKGIVITTGNFTRDAIRATETRPIELIAGSMLEKLFREL